MQFFIDSADIEEIRSAKNLGLCDGVTTNPSLVAKTGKDFKTVIGEIMAEVDGPLSLEVVSTDYEGMMAEAKKLIDVGPNVVVKIPLTTEGLRATRSCTELGIKTNVTLCFSSTQALLAAKAGATYISPFIGRLDDISNEGMQLIEEIITMYDQYDFETQVLVASVRNPVHVRDAALLGADVCTIPYKVITQLAQHPLTDIGLQKFLADWEKVPA